MDVNEVDARIQEAVQTLRALPDGARPRDQAGWWPDIPKDWWTSYGTEDARTARIMPSSASIDRLAEVMTWMTWLPGAVSKLVWCRAGGVAWKPLIVRFGRSRTTLYRDWLAAHVLIAERVNSNRSRDIVHDRGQMKQKQA